VLLLRQRHEATGISTTGISKGSEDCQAKVDVEGDKDTARAGDATLKQSMAGSGGKKRSSEKKGES
jgi:hypothetical protein